MHCEYQASKGCGFVATHCISRGIHTSTSNLIADALTHAACRNSRTSAILPSVFLLSFLLISRFIHQSHTVSFHNPRRYHCHLCCRLLLSLVIPATSHLVLGSPHSHFHLPIYRTKLT